MAWTSARPCSSSVSAPAGLAFCCSMAFCVLRPPSPAPAFDEWWQIGDAVAWEGPDGRGVHKWKSGGDDGTGRREFELSQPSQPSQPRAQAHLQEALSAGRRGGGRSRRRRIWRGGLAEAARGHAAVHLALGLQSVSPEDGGGQNRGRRKRAKRARKVTPLDEAGEEQCTQRTANGATASAEGCARQQKASKKLAGS